MSDARLLCWEQVIPDLIYRLQCLDGFRFADVRPCHDHFTDSRGKDFRCFQDAANMLGYNTFDLACWYAADFACFFAEFDGIRVDVVPILF